MGSACQPETKQKKNSVYDKAKPLAKLGENLPEALQLCLVEYKN